MPLSWDKTDASDETDASDVTDASDETDASGMPPRCYSTMFMYLIMGEKSLSLNIQ